MHDLRHASSNHSPPNQPTHLFLLFLLSFPPKKETNQSLFSLPSPKLMDERPSSRPPTKKGWFDRQFEHCDKEMLMGFELSNRSSSVADLLQNCDLPPPLKLFSLIEDDDKKTLVPQNSLPKPAPSKANKWDGGWGLDRGGENPSLLRALQLSQTRAREAEKKALLANAKNEQMASLLLQESLSLSAHRQWVKLLEMEVSMLEEKILRSQKEEEHAEDDAAPAAAAWCLTLALCLGIAGVGLALGRCIF
ncbi:uncharacterized protein LOC103696119 [Phoenix dactylifera]|uniref:Uncharacterized protein LOC103696119 n=1 Tax=Phoenix dactylifera TaxID=42345 RepID=A0A8B7BGD2_PHODC|nr:uncharacterized protein LOC103696119 [Phoenix dactylifera]